MKKFDVSILSVAILLTGLAVLGVYQAGEAKKDPVLVKAGDTSITQYQLYDEMKSTYGKQMIHEMVAQSLISQEAKAQKIQVTKEEMDKEIASMKQQVGSEEAFQSYLQGMGLDEKKLREKMSVLMTRDKLLDKAFPVTDEQVKQYYDENKQQMGSPAPEFEKVRDQIKSVLADKNRSENYNNWLNDIQKNHKVEWYDPSFDEPNKPAAG
ncbi:MULTISPECIES: SurA N-terminal domain-containing protein [Brevibacillus]|uniref:peptidylprolyl isomerase n=1 Tax=Brevibacillus parabrevis TaxID=54914 RepID=A0A4Y3PMV6_BREPA|nr:MULTISPECIES: SurA N-terminal domain-containing protein [Brevibacillus]NRQ53987.1 SurA N-terminal domain-containing protein [Brevibacillus sp. HD1.4A]MBU8713811.1 SurA N-terminal domain-containing protein [Brevibacillus parabrevis]MDH6350732.1 isopropylmalate/homocitrate/citramalate synthase [Brevibacillus sp. 1238]MDR4998221.1 SurA N-terminal domain-containing protein [Brevibacillus parabrevis]RNB94736.1 regulator [Brevibacillus parabrevis]